ncbi:MAG TPA: cytochrome c [Blastocatellia bacterium]|nr:cytochrome c [Blastocatellia bacterium]
MSLKNRQIKVVTAVAAAAVFTMVVAIRATNPVAAYGAADAAATFKSKCASCHGADGSGNTPAGKSLKLKDLRSAEVQGMSDDQLYQIIAKGKDKMPPYEKSLGADTCKALVAYIRKLKG